MLCTCLKLNCKKYERVEKTNNHPLQSNKSCQNKYDFCTKFKFNELHMIYDEHQQTHVTHIFL